MPKGLPDIPAREEWCIIAPCPFLLECEEHNNKRLRKSIYRLKKYHGCVCSVSYLCRLLNRLVLCPEEHVQQIVRWCHVYYQTFL